MSDPGPRHYLTADQIAVELGVHVQTVQRYFRDAGLPGRKIGGSWTTTRAALDTWIEEGNANRPELLADRTSTTLPLEHGVIPLETKQD